MLFRSKLKPPLLYSLQITPDFVRILFAIVDGDGAISIDSKTIKDNQFLWRCFPRKKKEPNFKCLRASLYSMLQSDDYSNDDWARLACMFLLADVLMPTLSDGISLRYTYYLDDLTKCCDFNWSLPSLIA